MYSRRVMSSVGDVNVVTMKSISKAEVVAWLLHDYVVKLY